MPSKARQSSSKTTTKTREKGRSQAATRAEAAQSGTKPPPLTAPTADSLLHFIDTCPTPHHAVATCTGTLEDAGFIELKETEAWTLEKKQKVFVRRGGSILALHIGTSLPEQSGFRLIGAHTDSPNLRVKPQPAKSVAGIDQLRVETYGGLLFYTWLDRDLSLAGRIVAKQGDELRSELVRFDQALLHIPSVAIHLNRTVNRDGLTLNPEQHLTPMLGLSGDKGGDFRNLLATQLGKQVREEHIRSWDLSAYDLSPSARVGRRGEFISAPRLDNLASCHAALVSLLSAPKKTSAHSTGFVFYDHEECGSRSAAGAQSEFVATTLSRLVGAIKRGSKSPKSSHPEELLARALAHSFLLSADMAHAVHPNYPEKHSSARSPVLGAGPVVKHNEDQAYATEAEGAAWIEDLAKNEGIPLQHFSSRNDMACGSTIGPISAARLGIRTLDIGNPMLAMHSCREMAAADDHDKMIALMSAYYQEH